jgi:hypothetical protein
MPEFLDWSIIGPAFAAGVIILSTHVPLGQEVLNRGIIFIDLAIAQVAGLGVIAAYAMEWDPEGIQVQIAAVSAALVAAVGLNWTEKRWPGIQEPAASTSKSCSSGRFYGRPGRRWCRLRFSMWSSWRFGLVFGHNWVA